MASPGLSEKIAQKAVWESQRFPDGFFMAVKKAVKPIDPARSADRMAWGVHGTPS